MVEKVKTESVLEECVVLGGKRFFEEGSIPGKFIPEVFRENWKRLLMSGMGAMWVSRHDEQVTGALGAIIYPDINDNALVAMEAFWYVMPEHRGKMDSIRLFQQFEKWAIQREAKRLIMVHYLQTSGTKLEDFYKRNGYRDIEKIFVKEMKWQ